MPHDTSSEMKQKFLTIIFSIILTSTFAFGQSAKEQLAIANSARLISKDFYDEIKFSDKLGYFTIQVKIDSATYEYIFDTGGYNTVTTKIMNNSNLPTLLEVEVGSSNKLKSKIKLSKIPLLQIGKASFENVGVFNFDFNASPVINCYTNGGLIGKSVIHEAIWQIDYKKSVIRVSDNISKMPFLDNSQKLKIEFDKTLNPFVEILINGSKQKFLLDFGFGGLISLTDKTASSLNFKKVLTIEGEGNISANGVVLEKTFIAALDNVNIGNSTIGNQVAYFSKSNNYNLLGSELTKYFIVTLNFKDKELILTPYNDSLSGFATFGFNVNIDDKKIYVSKIFNDLDVQKSGLRVNDELLSINETDLTFLSICDRYFFVNNILKNATETNLKVRRETEVREIKVIRQKPF